MKRRILLGVGGVGVLGLLLLLYFFPRLTQAHLAAQQQSIAERHQYIAQAICDFRARSGMLPEDLQELVSTYLSALPTNSSAIYSNGTLAIHAGWPHTYVGYSFRSGNEGWTSGGDFGIGPLPVPRVTPSVVPRSGDDLVRARLAMYDRRIAAAAENLLQRTEKIAYLLSLKRREDAYSECDAASLAQPAWWRPQLGLALLAPPEKTQAAETRFCSWVERHPGFVHYWYLAHYYRSLGRTQDALAALRQGAKYPLEDVDPDAGWVPHAFAFDAASYACRQQDPTLVLAITDTWSSPRGVYNYASPDLPAFRAAAKLALGRIREARADADTVIATSRTRAIWAGNLDQLDSAISRKDRSFVYDPGNRCCGLSDWSPFPASE
jgi:tetratricopeptide (TPR) repeat protein